MSAFKPEKRKRKGPKKCVFLPYDICICLWAWKLQSCLFIVLSLAHLCLNYSYRHSRSPWCIFAPFSVTPEEASLLRMRQSSTLCKVNKLRTRMRQLSWSNLGWLRRRGWHSVLALSSGLWCYGQMFVFHRQEWKTAMTSAWGQQDSGPGTGSDSEEVRWG